MSLTHRQEAFAQAVAAGKSQSAAYREAYPKSQQWKPDAQWCAGAKMMAIGRVAERIGAIRAELAERGLWSREESVKVLREVATTAEKPADRVRAVAELNAMSGFRAPERIEHSGSVTSITRRIIDADDA